MSFGKRQHILHFSGLFEQSTNEINQGLRTEYSPRSYLLLICRTILIFCPAIGP
jgi:hypothetical protein